MYWLGDCGISVRVCRTVGVELERAAHLLDDLARAHDDVGAGVAHDARHLHAVPARAVRHEIIHIFYLYSALILS